MRVHGFETNISRMEQDRVEMKSNVPSRKYLARLAEMVLESLKEISSQKRPLTCSTLSDALGSHPDLENIVPKMQVFQVDPPRIPFSNKDGFTRLREEIRNLQLQKNRLNRQLGELEDAKSQNDQFFRRVVLTLITLSMNPVDTHTQALLLQFRELLRAKADVAVIKELYKELKDMVLSQGVCDPLETSTDLESGSIWGKIFPGNKVGGEQGALTEIYSRKLRQLYQDILLLLPPELDPVSAGRARALQSLLANDLRTEHLLSLKREVTSLLGASFKSIVHEKTQIAGFLSEMGKNLTDIENLLLSSVGNSAARQRAQQELGVLIEGHMNDIQDSLSAAGNLDELKSLVSSKMMTIKAALEARRAADAKELERISEKMGGLQEKIQRVRTEIEQVQQKAKKLEQEVLRDPLTDTSNRRAYEKRLQEEVDRFQRYGQVFSLLLFDVDEFKAVNERYGHTAGDKCLQEISGRVQKILRASDFLARYGGDEFVILLPGVGKEKLSAVAEKVRAEVHNLRLLYQGEPIALSLSLGGSEINSNDSTGESLFVRADGALFEAKKGGRNRAVIF